MKFKRKQKPTYQRTPQIVRQKQSTFQYSSNRSGVERQYDRHEVYEDEHDLAVKEQLKRRRTTAKWIFLSTGIVLILGSIIFLGLDGKARLSVVDSNPIRSNDVYAKKTSEITGNGPANHTKLTINRNKISEDLQNAFPEITSVDVYTPVFSRTAQIKIKISKPLATLQSDNGKFLIDNRGIAIVDMDKTKLKSSTDSLVPLKDESGADINVGKPALTTSQIEFIQVVKAQSDAKKLPIESATLVAGGGELQVKYKDLPYFVKYSLYEEGRKSFGTFIATKEYLQSTKVVPEEYIDVRIPERAYIR